MTLDYITLENGLDYAVMDAVVVDNNNYILLVNENDDDDITIRKIDKENGREYFTKLDSEEEFDKVMAEIAKKHEGDGKNE